MLPANGKRVRREKERGVERREKSGEEQYDSGRKILEGKWWKRLLVEGMLSEMTYIFPLSERNPETLVVGMSAAVSLKRGEHEGRSLLYF